MRIICLVVCLLATTSFARAEDVAFLISQYRKAHGLSAVKVDADLTAVAERQAQAMAKAGVMDHNVAGPFSVRMAGVRRGGREFGGGHQDLGRDHPALGGVTGP